MGQPEQRFWTVGALAGAAGVTVRTLHHYDRLGLLAPSGRTGGGHRRYTEVDVARLYRVLALRGLGLALDTILAVLDTDEPDPLLATARRQRDRVQQQLHDTNQLRDRLDTVIHRLEHDSTTPTHALLNTLETMAMTIHLTRIYTRTGDGGDTDLADRTRVPKTDPRIEAVGAVDELNATLGVARATGALPENYSSWLTQIQHNLFDLGADLSHPATTTHPAPRPAVDAAAVMWLETICDQVNAHLPALESFVLPGGTLLAAQLHVCRTVCRRAERRTLAVPDVNPETARYLNRLSDLLFILSRADNTAGSEPLWQPRHRPG